MTVGTPPGCTDPRARPASGVALDLTGARPVLVVPDELHTAAAGLAAACHAVERVGQDLVRARLSRALDAAALAGLEVAATRAARLADDLDALAAHLRRSADGYTGADATGFQLTGAIGQVLGDHPLVLGVLGAAALALGARQVVADVADAASAGDRDPLGDGVARAAGGLTRDGRTTAAAGLLGGVLTGLLPGRASIAVSVPRVAAGLSAMGGAPPRAVTVPLDTAPDLPAPGGLADLVGAVDAAYDETSPQPRDGVLLVQRLRHADGSTSWVVAIPGTQSVGLGTRTVTDLSTNLELVAGASDQLSQGVLTAMADAGVGPGDPVLLTGHSLGGMAAQAAAIAAAGRYSVRSVVTIGSPLLTRPLPTGIGLTTLENPQDAVPQLDGGRRVPVGPDRLVITGDPLGRPGRSEGPSVAHGRPAYAALARAADRQLAAAGRSVPGMADVVDGVVGVHTTAYQVTRDAATVAGAR